MKAQILSLLLIVSNISCMDKFNSIERDPFVAIALNAAVSLSIQDETIDHYAGLLIDPNTIKMIIKTNIIPQMKMYYNLSLHTMQFYNAVNENFTAHLATGEKIECHYTQTTPTSGEIRARAFVHHNRCFFPLPIPQENFFILKEFHERLKAHNTPR